MVLPAQSMTRTLGIGLLVVWVVESPISVPEGDSIEVRGKSDDSVRIVARVS